MPHDPPPMPLEGRALVVASVLKGYASDLIEQGIVEHSEVVEALSFVLRFILSPTGPRSPTPIMPPSGTRLN